MSVAISVQVLRLSATPSSATYTYDGFGRLEQLWHYRVGGTGSGPACAPSGSYEALASYVYTLRADGRRSGVSEHRYPTTGNDDRVGADIVYRYDALNRLIGEEYTGTTDAAPDDYVIDYTYDLAGNRKTLVEQVSPGGAVRRNITYVYDPDLDRLMTETDAAVGGGVTSYVYDDNGFVISKARDAMTAVYDADVEGRLASMTDPWSGLVSPAALGYDHNGVRVSKDATTYLVDSNNHTGYAQVVQERQGAAPTLDFVLGDDVLGFALQTGAQRAYLYDGHGSVRGLEYDAKAAFELKMKIQLSVVPVRSPALCKRGRNLMTINECLQSTLLPETAQKLGEFVRFIQEIIRDLKKQFRPIIREARAVKRSFHRGLSTFSARAGTAQSSTSSSPAASSRLTPREQLVWSALEGRRFTAKELVKELSLSNCDEENVRSYIRSIRKKDFEIENKRGATGYYRPDAPPRD